LEKIKNVDKYLELNTKIILDVKSGDHRGLFDSRIEDIENNVIHVSMPSKQGNTVILREGNRIDVSFLSELGRYSFSSIVVSRIQGHIPMLKIKKPDILIKKELREFFRVETRLPVNIFYELPVPEPEEGEEPAKPERIQLQGTVSDVSGGGLRIVTDKKFDRGSVLMIQFLEGVENIGIINCEVVRCIEANEKFQLGVKFNGLTGGERDKIIKYVFQRQLELRKMLG